MLPINHKRLLITICGCVQGVGFRPFVHRLAHHYRLAGHIRNTTSGVDIDVQGEVDDLEKFQIDLVNAKPERSFISEIKVSEASLQKVEHFEIKKSESGADTTLALLPDTSICRECLQELDDPANRRHHYPFIHCMTCGPRFSLFLRMPFDRCNTTMSDFFMCDLCQIEYANPSDRRFFSQTNCCPGCGPKLRLVDHKNKEIVQEKDAIGASAHYLRQGKIVAVKNTGGYLLLCDATNEDAVSRLRFVKQRKKKPFAVMGTLSQAKEMAIVDHAAEDLLTSPAGPIVLLKKLPIRSHLAPSVAYDSPYYGIMLPHNALQHLLIRDVKKPLVATSGNVTGRAICITEEDAFSQLSQVADVFLVHNRRIMHRLDDSVAHIIGDRPMLIRRSRGYIPYAAPLPEPLPECILGAGGELKNSFAFAKGSQVYVSQYIGDLSNTSISQIYEEEIKSWEKLLTITSKVGVGDKHPGYYTSNYLQKRKIASNPIQHHKAHVFSGMLDNQLSPPLLAVSWDGTGLGDDGTIWGGETFIVTEDGIKRFASLYPFRLIGSEKAVREPRRSALGALHAMSNGQISFLFEAWTPKAFSKEELKILSVALKKGINAPVCSSMGRLFDAVSALLDCCLISQFEGEAALALEALATKAENEPWCYTIPLLKEKDLLLLDWRPMIDQIFKDKMQQIPLADIAMSFHLSLAQSIVELSCSASIERVLLTGGVMQNRLLAEAAILKLKQAGFKPFWHEQIPPNDSGLAPGQIVGKFLETKWK